MIKHENRENISYTSRPLTITKEGYTAQFTYEAGGDREKIWVTQNGTPVLTRHYLANQYELDEKPGSNIKCYSIASRKEAILYTAWNCD
mgnify:CR=1 FL=1